MKGMRKPGALPMVVVLVVAMLSTAGVIVLFRTTAPRAAQPGAAEVVAAFSRPQTDAARRVSDAQAALFTQVFTRNIPQSSLITINAPDPARLRRFQLGDASRFEVTAAPTASGGICYLDSLSGGGCFDSFTHGAGMIMSFGRTHHLAITGMVPDGVVELSVRTKTGATFVTKAVNNVYRLDVPRGISPSEIRQYVMTYVNGTKYVSQLDPGPSAAESLERDTP